MAQFEFPLAWPTGQPRTPGVDRQWSKFGKKREQGWGRDDLTVHQAANRLVAEVRAFMRTGKPWRINPDQVVVSTNLRVLKSTGFPDTRQSKPADPGVAVYFDLDGQPYCLPCDKWATVAGNLAAVAAHLNAIRGIERWGVGDLRAQFAGFQALPDPDRIIWRDALGYEKAARPSAEELRARFQALRSKHHPDKGGTATEFDRVMKAYDLAMKELGYAN